MKAIIPVAGAGTKLRPHTYTQPKALIPIAGKTILSFIVDQLKEAGIHEFIFIVGYLGEKIQDYVKQTYPDLTTHFVFQNERQGTGHAIELTRNIVGTDEVFVALGAEDLKAAVEAGPDAILVPKISKPEDLHEIDNRIGHKSAVRVWAMVETPLAILNIQAIASAAGRLSCFVMGTNDLIKEVRGLHTPDRMNLSAALGLSVLAARANGLAVIDGVYNDIQNTDGFAETCRHGRAFGFDGKTLIHPSQLEACNDIFAPSPAEVDAARKVIAAFELPENKGKGAIKVDGRMVELLHAEIAKATVALADAIAEMNS